VSETTNKTTRFEARRQRRWHPLVPPRWGVFDTEAGTFVGTAWGADPEQTAHDEAARLNAEARRPQRDTADHRRWSALFNDITHAGIPRLYYSDRVKLAHHLWAQGWRRDVRPEDDVTLDAEVSR
jgi:hypothetical protein